MKITATYPDLRPILEKNSTIIDHKMAMLDNLFTTEYQIYNLESESIKVVFEENPVDLLIFLKSINCLDHFERVLTMSGNKWEADRLSEEIYNIKIWDFVDRIYKNVEIDKLELEYFINFIENSTANLISILFGLSLELKNLNPSLDRVVELYMKLQIEAVSEETRR